MSVQKLPCVNCITLSICKAHVDDGPGYYVKRDKVLDLCKKCTLLHKYCIRIEMKYKTAKVYGRSCRYPSYFLTHRENRIRNTVKYLIEGYI